MSLLMPSYSFSYVWFCFLFIVIEKRGDNKKDKEVSEREGEGPKTIMDRKSFIDLIDSEQDEHVKLLQALVRAPYPNPPGDTLDAANVLRELSLIHI